MKTISLYQQLNWSDLISSNVELYDYIHFPNDSESYKEVLVELESANIIGFDIETYGKEPWMALYPWKGKIRSLQIGLPSGKVIIVDLGGWTEQKEVSTKERIEQLSDPAKQTLDILKAKLFCRNTTVLGANLIFDATFIRVHLDWVIRQCRDIVVMSQVLWGGVGSWGKMCTLSHSFGAICQRLDIDIKKGYGASNWGWSLSNEQINYQAEDVKYLFPAYEALKSLIIRDGCLFSAYVECQSVTVFAEMQYQGFPVSLDLAKQFVTDTQKKVDILYSNWELAFPGVSPTSQPQVLEAINNVLPKERQISSVGKEILNGLDISFLDAKYRTAIESLGEVRKLETSKKYAQGIIDYAFDGGTGRDAIRTQFFQNAPAGTGRTSVKSSIKGVTIGVQLQNPAKDLRHIFRHTDPEKSLFIYDASGSHMRIAAQYSSDYWESLGRDPSETNIVKIFRDNFDGHSVYAVDIANHLYDKDWTVATFLSKLKEVGSQGNPTQDSLIAKKCREKGAKMAFYSAINGSGPNRVLEAMTANGFNCTFNDAKYVTTRLGFHHPNLVEFIKTRPSVVNATEVSFSFLDSRGKSMKDQKYAYVKSLTGRRQYFLKYPKNSYDKASKVYLENEYEKDVSGNIIYEANFTNSLAAHWLLVESDVMKDIAWQLQDKFYEMPHWGATIFNMVHDEINGECLTQYRQEVGDFIREVFRSCFSRWVKIIPVLADTFEQDSCYGFAESWADK